MSPKGREPTSASGSQVSGSGCLYPALEERHLLLLLVAALQMDLLRDWPKLALDRELWKGVASRC